MMSDLITRHLMAETGPEEEAALLEWRRADPANEAYYHRRKRLWALLGKVGGATARRAPSADELIERSGVHRLPVRGEPVAARGGRRFGAGARWSRLAPIAALAAASIAALIVVASRPEPEASLGVVEFITGPHEVNTLRLTDGTIVRMARGSKLEIDNRSPRARRVSFEGVGYFAVARDPTRPFIVRTKGGDAVVLGTRFELRTQDREVRVVVVEGKVALEAEGERKEVSMNQMGYARVDQPPSVVNVERVGDYVTWVDGLLVFQSTPLSQVARELSEHYGREIEVQDAELARREVTAWLQEQSFDAAMTAICGAVGASCTIHPDGATMRLPRPAGRLTEHSPAATRR